MTRLDKQVFTCLDCEMTGLDPHNDRIIELAAVRFTLNGPLDQMECLVNPNCPIPPESQAIHNISDEMVANKPPIKDVLPQFLKFIGRDIIIGHGIRHDIEVLSAEAQREKVQSRLSNNPLIDTLRLARLYGECPTNSLAMLCQHFNIPHPDAHRAMADVQVNIEVFKRLITKFQTTQQLFSRLEKPVPIKIMPLGPYKGRLMKDVPQEFLIWAANKEFDQDLLFSIRRELKRRKQGGLFNQATNPFNQL